MSNDQTSMPASLAEALSILQGKLPKIERTSKATVKTQTGPSYSYSYADLAAVSGQILPLLAEVGLAFLAKPTLIDGRFVLAYRLLHVSGESEDGEYPLPSSGSPQQVGSAITYARRYVLSALVGVATSDDDDGQAAAQHDKPPARAPRARNAAAAAGRQQDDPDLISPEQRKAIMAGFGDLDITDRDVRMNITRRLAGVPDLASTSDLTRAQARQVLAGIDAKRNARPDTQPLPHERQHPDPEGVKPQVTDGADTKMTPLPGAAG